MSEKIVLLFLSSRIESNVWLDSDLRKNEKNTKQYMILKNLVLLEQSEVDLVK